MMLDSSKAKGVAEQNNRRFTYEMHVTSFLFCCVCPHLLKTVLSSNWFK